MNPILFRPKYLLLISANPKLSPRFGLHLTETGASELQISKVGFPIRKFTDQSLFAAPHDLSQRTTSFIASQRQGIHRIPLRHLIALIIDAHRSAAAVSHSLLNTERYIDRKTICFKCIRERRGQADVHCWYARRQPQILPAIVTRSDALPLHDVENPADAL